MNKKWKIEKDVFTINLKSSKCGNNPLLGATFRLEFMECTYPVFMARKVFCHNNIDKEELAFTYYLN